MSKFSAALLVAALLAGCTPSGPEATVATTPEAVSAQTTQAVSTAAAPVPESAAETALAGSTTATPMATGGVAQTAIPLSTAVATEDAITETTETVTTDTSVTTATETPETTAGSLSATSTVSRVQEYPVPPGSHPHDVAPAPDGRVWYTAQATGELGILDPATGETRHIKLGSGSAPHGVIAGPDGAAWITDGGLNAIVRVDAVTEQVRTFPLPPERPSANLNTAAFDARGLLWFTGQNGIYGKLDPASGQMEVFDAVRGRGPYGIATASDGTVYFASLAGSYVGRIDIETGAATILEPPTMGQGARRVWPDSQGRVWVSEWNAGNVAMYDPASEQWREWRLPGEQPKPYAVYVDERDVIWLSDFGANALVSFDPANEAFETFTLPSSPANVRQILGRPGEVWGAESGVDKLVVIRTN